MKHDLLTAAKWANESLGDYSRDDHSHALCELGTQVDNFENTALGMVYVERNRQIEKGYFPSHDSGHDTGELIQAAAVYMASATKFDIGLHDVPLPWEKTGSIGNDPIKNLAKAAALLVAEIERLQNISRP